MTVLLPCVRACKQAQLSRVETIWMLRVCVCVCEVCGTVRDNATTTKHTAISLKTININDWNKDRGRNVENKKRQPPPPPAVNFLEIKFKFYGFFLSKGHKEAKRLSPFGWNYVQCWWWSRLFWWMANTTRQEISPPPPPALITFTRSSKSTLQTKCEIQVTSGTRCQSASNQVFFEKPKQKRQALAHTHTHTEVITLVCIQQAIYEKFTFDPPHHGMHTPGQRWSGGGGEVKWRIKHT